MVRYGAKTMNDTDSSGIERFRVELTVRFGDQPLGTTMFVSADSKERAEKEARQRLAGVVSENEAEVSIKNGSDNPRSVATGSEQGELNE